MEHRRMHLLKLYIDFDRCAQEDPPVLVCGRKPPGPDVDLQGGVQQSRSSEDGITILPPLNERRSIRAFLDVLVPCTLISNGGEASLVPVLRVIMPNIEAVIPGQGEQPLHGLQTSDVR